MTCFVDVHLVSGRGVTLATEADDSVFALKKRAQAAFAVAGGRLLNCSGGVLNGTATVEQTGLQTGDVLTFLVKLHQVTASKQRWFCAGAAFAAIRDDGCVVTWGHADFGGDSRAVQDRLHNVQHIQSGFRAFAAILDDGSVVTWGDPRHGGDCSAVQHQLKNVPRSDSSTLIPFFPIQCGPWVYPLVPRALLWQGAHFGLRGVFLQSLGAQGFDC